MARTWKVKEPKKITIKKKKKITVAPKREFYVFDFDGEEGAFVMANSKTSAIEAYYKEAIGGDFVNDIDGDDFFVMERRHMKHYTYTYKAGQSRIELTSAPVV